MKYSIPVRSVMSSDSLFVIVTPAAASAEYVKPAGNFSIAAISASSSIES